jgi:hypothetical protein
MTGRLPGGREREREGWPASGARWAGRQGKASVLAVPHPFAPSGGVDSGRSRELLREKGAMHAALVGGSPAGPACAGLVSARRNNATGFRAFPALIIPGCGGTPALTWVRPGDWPGRLDSLRRGSYGFNDIPVAQPTVKPTEA